jgi:hypothetical protein
LLTALIGGVMFLVIGGVAVLLVLWLTGFGFTYSTSGSIECRERTIVFHQLQCHKPGDPTSVWSDQDAPPGGLDRSSSPGSVASEDDGPPGGYDSEGFPVDESGAVSSNPEDYRELVCERVGDMADDYQSECVDKGY